MGLRKASYKKKKRSTKALRAGKRAATESPEAADPQAPPCTPPAAAPAAPRMLTSAGSARTSYLPPVRRFATQIAYRPGCLIRPRGAARDPPEAAGVPAPANVQQEEEGGPPARPCTPPAGPRPNALTPTTPAKISTVLQPLAFLTSTPRAAREIFHFTDREPSPVRPFRELQQNDNEEDEPVEPRPELSGRRIVRIMEFIKQIQNDSHAPVGEDCSFLDSEFIGEEPCGFKSILLFKCKKCFTVTRLDTDKCDGDTLGVNRAMVTGALAGGGGFANLDEMAAAVDMHCMSRTTYIRHERALGLTFEEVALEKMLAAGEEERRLAIEAKDFAPDGTPRIRVIADGMWSKRAYGNKYDALSGVAFIIGARTGKILFYGVRNKHCYVCALDKNRKVPVRQHDCAKNFVGSSGQMEASIILEGFKASEDMHGVRYYQLVGDRDSSVHNLLVQQAPYGPLEIVQKIDCKNHLLRNYRSWCLQLSGNTHLPLPDGADTKDQKQVQFWRKELRSLRCMVRDNMRRLSKGISKAATYRGKEDGSTVQARTDKLREDILNVAAHVFGDHGACAEYFCETAQQRAAAPGTTTVGPSQCTAQAAPEAARKNWVPRFQAAGVWPLIMKDLNTMADHADSLIHNVNNNLCEVTNSQVAKFIAGKRVFYSSRHSFNVRCAAAALAMNTSGEFRKVIHKKLQSGKSPGKFTARHSAMKARRLKLQRARRLFARTQGGAGARRAWQVHGPDRDYGLEARAPGDRDASVDDPAPTDLEPLEEDPQLENKMKGVTDRLEADLGQLERIASFRQGGPQWLEARALRLTACNFGPVCRRPKTNTCKNIVRHLQHSKLPPTAAMKHGTQMEEVARKFFEKETGLVVGQTGLVVDRRLPFLAASPDGLIGDDLLLEIKCPTSGADFPSAEDAVRGKKLPYLKFEDDGQSLYLDSRSDHHFQIQGQLHMTGRKECKLFICQFKIKIDKREEPQVIWHKTFTVKRDDEFWSREMEPQLTEFYYGCLLQEIASPRHTVREKVEDIRELPSVITAREEQGRLVEEKRREKERKAEERQLERARKAEERQLEKERKAEERQLEKARKEGERRREQERKAEERRKRPAEEEAKGRVKRQRVSTHGKNNV